MKRFFSRLSLLTKVMLSTSVAITLLFAVTGEFVLRNITNTMSESLAEEVQSSFHAYASFWKTRTEPRRACGWRPRATRLRCCPDRREN